ncbi:MAG: thioesterase family protein [archaeon]|nr:thioesterase family protein [archaeon]
MEKIFLFSFLLCFISILSVDLKEGMTHSKTITVTQNITADALGNSGVHVFATPYLVNLIEGTSRELLEKDLEKGKGTVGTEINVKHLGATPVGMDVTCNIKCIKVDGRRFVFEAEVFDEVELIATATHERFIINQDKFLQKAETKKNQKKVKE